MIVGILIMWKSIHISLKRRMVVSWFITFIIAVSFALAEYMLFLISFTSMANIFTAHFVGSKFNTVRYSVAAKKPKSRSWKMLAEKEIQQKLKCVH